MRAKAACSGKDIIIELNFLKANYEVNPCTDLEQSMAGCFQLAKLKKQASGHAIGYEPLRIIR